MTFYIGLDVETYDKDVQTQKILKYDFIIQNIGMNYDIIENFKKIKSDGLNSLDSNRCILGKLSNPIEDLEYHLQYAQYLGFPAILMQLNSNFIELSKRICQIIHNNIIHSQIVFEFQLGNLSDHINGYSDNVKEPNLDSWDLWDSMKGILMDLVLENLNQSGNSSANGSRIQLALTLSSEIPSTQILNRWLTEPIKYVIIPTNLFVTNKLGYPILSKAHQHMFNSIFKINPYIIIRAKSLDEPVDIYQEYIAHIRKVYESNNPQLKFSSNYEDILQFPLQPLGDHLDSYTYETFEMDDEKYTLYEEAIYYSLLERSAETTITDDSLPNLIMVVGAGRGPLITASLNAARRSHRKVKIVAIEKNPFSFLVLKDKLRKNWSQDPVILIRGDMRTIPDALPVDKLLSTLDSSIKMDQLATTNAPFEVLYSIAAAKLTDGKNCAKGDGEFSLKLNCSVDIMVSELLGSFADNELSPECLYGAQRFLKRDGISIPQSYTSYICPIMSSRLYAEVYNYQQMDVNVKTINTFSHFEMPFVVNACRCLSISDPKPVFTFQHPESQMWQESGREDRNDLSTRRIVVRFPNQLEIDSYLHGFAGYFEATLYKHVRLSTLPKTQTKNMHSWFPIYFPIKEPLFISKYLKENAITLYMWRCRDSAKVWYEWSVGVRRDPSSLYDITTPIHNVNGRSYTISLLS